MNCNFKNIYFSSLWPFIWLFKKNSKKKYDQKLTNYFSSCLEDDKIIFI